MKIRVILVLVSALILSCNIFSNFANPSLDDNVDFSIKELKNRYIKLINKGKYDSAIIVAQKIEASYPNLSDGYVLEAKAIRYLYFNKYALLQELLKVFNENYQFSYNSLNTIPFWNYDIYKLDSIYYANKKILDLLSILKNNSNLEGEYTFDDLLVDYILANTIYSLISLKDLNRNGTILDDTLFFNAFNILFTDSGLTFENFDSLYSIIKDNPAMFNNLLDNTDSLLKISKSLITNYGDLDSTTLEKVDSLVNIVGENLDYYKIGDQIDNDGDGLIDEETIDGKDNDGDGLIDEDSNAFPSEFSIDSSLFR